jgi:hypothetical protein
MLHMHTATATAPQTPSRDQVAAAWACLAACWGVQVLVVQQHGLAVGAASDDVTRAANAEADATEHLSAALQQLSAKMNSSSAEADAAKVQFVASTALAEACQAAQQAATAAAALQSSNSPSTAMHQHGLATNSSGVGNGPSTDAPVKRLHALQVQLAALQAAMGEYEQSDLSFILDPSTSALSDELPEAALSLEDLIDAGEAEQAAAVLQQSAAATAGKQHWQQRLAAVSVQLQLLPQLLLAVQYEALGPIAAWHAAAVAGAHVAHGQHEQQLELVVLPAGAVSQQQLWHAAAAHLQQHWQQLQQLLLQAMELEGCMHALAAVAAAGGAAAIWLEDVDLMSRAISLQQMLLPQGFDILTTDECVASAQLLQAQWTDLEQRLWLAFDEALAPMLGLQGTEGLPGQQGGQQDAGGSRVLVLRHLLDAAASSVVGASIMHCQDVLEVLAAANAGSSSGSMGSSSNVWGVPGVSDAWRGLVLLLLQYGCLQQQLLTPQQAAEDLDLAAAGLDSSRLDVLRSSKALPMEVEAQRPLFVAVQVMHELLCSQGQHAAAAAGPSISLQQHLEGIMLAPVLQQVGSSLHQTLGSLQQHLSVLASEAQGVLSRFDQPQDPQQQQQPAGGSSSATGHMQDGLTPLSGADAAAGDGADLVPFDAFDMSLPGADVLLEDLGSGGGYDTAADWALEGRQQGSTQGSDAAAAQAAAAAGLSDLVPFDAFDDGLEGAGMLLEDGGLEGGSKGLEAEECAGGFFGDLDGQESDMLGGALEDEQPAAVVQQGQGSNMQGAQGAVTAPGAAEAEARALAQLLMAVGWHSAAAALRQQQLVGLQHVQGSCAWQQQVWLRHLAAFEWLWGDMLPQQGQEDDAAGLANQQQQLVHAAAIALGLQAQDTAGLDTTPGEAYQLYCAGLSEQLPSRQESCQPRNSSSTGDDTGQEQQQQQRMPSSVELLQAWQVLCEHQAAVADALQAWRVACTAAASAVADVLLGAPGAPADVPALHLTDPTVCRKVSSAPGHPHLRVM